MGTRVEVLLATMDRRNTEIVEKMCIKSPVFIANQTDEFRYTENNKDDYKVRMLSTTTKGVGVNRDFGLLYSEEDILLFADDDMIYYRGYEQTIIEGFHKFPDADVIIFNFDFEQDGVLTRKRIKKTERVRFYNAFQYGACSIAIKRAQAKKCNLHFSTLFGGGCIYGSGEDSLFILDCLKAGLRIYACESLIGKNICRESTWFSGYNEKYFYDKGAWIACAFPKAKFLFRYYFAFRIGSKMTKLTFKEKLKYMCAGGKGFKTLKSFEEWEMEIMC